MLKMGAIDLMRKVASRKFQPQIGLAWLISKWTLAFFLRQGQTPLRTFSLNLVSSLLLRQGVLSISCQTKTRLMWRINYTRLTEASILINTFKFTYRRSIDAQHILKDPPPPHKLLDTSTQALLTLPCICFVVLGVLFIINQELFQTKLECGDTCLCFNK